MRTPSKKLQAQLKKSEPEIQAFFDALRLKMAKLQKRLGTVEAENVSLEARIVDLEEQVRQSKAKEEAEQRHKIEAMPESERFRELKARLKRLHSRS